MTKAVFKGAPEVVEGGAGGASRTSEPGTGAGVGDVMIMMSDGKFSQCHCKAISRCLTGFCTLAHI